MQKVTFQIPELDGKRKFFVRVEDGKPLDGCHGFLAPWHWRNNKSATGFTHDLEIDVQDNGILEMEAYAYIVNPDNIREVVNDVSHPLTVIFLSYERGV